MTPKSVTLPAVDLVPGQLFYFDGSPRLHRAISARSIGNGADEVTFGNIGNNEGVRVVSLPAGTSVAPYIKAETVTT